MTNKGNRSIINQYLVTSQQMQSIEARIFNAGMPIAALMEKVGGLIYQWITKKFPINTVKKVGILVGSGHNGGDALVVARELFLAGYSVIIFCPLVGGKELTQQHQEYVISLGVNIASNVEDLANCDLIIDGLFGFGLNRSIEEPLITIINEINTWQKTVISIDLPSGLHTDTGMVLGTAIRANYTLCLGLWKLAFIQESALNYLGEVELIDFGIPLGDIQAILGDNPQITRFTRDLADQYLPLTRLAQSHKYQQGNLLLICGSKDYIGAAILAGLGARATGIGMLSIAVPESLKSIIINHLPEALIIACPETRSGTIKKLPNLAFNRYNAIACGCGLTTKPVKIIEQILALDKPLILDADALNIIAQQNLLPIIKQRQDTTILTPHSGEFKRLFPTIDLDDRLTAASSAANTTNAIILLKGARSIVASSTPELNILPESTPALARGGSGDVLLGLIGGLLAQQSTSKHLHPKIVITSAWWHAQAAIMAAREHTVMGVDPLTLINYLKSLLSE